MSYAYSADDVFEMAVRIEKNGAAFYRDAAGRIAAPEAKTLLNRLADMEEGHERTFSRMREKLTRPDAAGMFDPEGEAAGYLKALADARVFAEKRPPDAPAGRPVEKTLEDILMEAIGAEKDSIVFYLGMKDMAADAEDKRRIDAVIKEEMQHIRLLSTELTTVKNG